MKRILRMVPLYLSAILITIAAIANLIRFLLSINVTIGGNSIPPWTGAVAFVVLGLLAWWSFKSLLYRPLSPPPTDLTKL